jgi:hypothetical protein
MPTLTTAQFRTDFPEFADTTTYPDSTIQFWINFAYLMLNATMWGTTLNMGLELFVAHNMVLEANAQITASVGGLPGVSRGVIASETPGAVSISYDTGSGVQQGAGHWNLTVYGTRFYRVMNMVGMKPIMCGVGCGGSSIAGMGFSNAWPGPMFPTLHGEGG